MLLTALVLLAQLSSPQPSPAQTPAPGATVAPLVAETPVPRPTLGPDRPGARFGSNPAIDLTDPRNAALELGHRHLDKWETDKALKVYKKFVKKNDTFADGHYWLGLAADMSGDPLVGCAELRRYMKLEPAGFYVPAAKSRSAACPPPPKDAFAPPSP